MACSQHHHETAGCCPLHGGGISRRSFAKGFLASASAAALAACSTNPVTGRSNFGTIQDDVSLGRQEHPNILKAFGGEYKDQRLDGYVQQIGATLAQKTEFASISYRFTVLDTPIVNAFALPGGYIYVTRGLLALASNEAELAGVLGHEIGHVTARHTSERQTQSVVAQLGLAILGAATGSSAVTDLASVGAAAYLQSYSRDQEMEADTLGVRYMSLGGYDPEGMVTFLASLREYSQLEARMAGQDPGTVDDYNMMASHPRTIDRVQAAMKAADVARPADPIVGHEIYLRRIDGMLYGDDPTQGVVEGQTFRHPGLRIAFTVPRGFQLTNADDAVTAQTSQGAGVIFDMGRNSGGDMAAYLVNQWAQGAQVQDLERITVNGMQGATGWLRSSVNGTSVDLRAVALQGDGNQVFRFLFVAPSRSASQWTAAFRETLNSVRRLTAQEAAQIRGYHLRIVTTTQSDSVASLSRTMPYGRFNEDLFRVLNDLAGGGQPADGILVKVVTG